MHTHHVAGWDTQKMLIMSAVCTTESAETMLGQAMSAHTTRGHCGSQRTSTSHEACKQRSRQIQHVKPIYILEIIQSMILLASTLGCSRLSLRAGQSGRRRKCSKGQNLGTTTHQGCYDVSRQLFQARCRLFAQVHCLHKDSTQSLQVHRND